MSLWGVHIGIAVMITSLVVVYFRLSRAERWILVLLSGIFATVPDWWWLFTERFLPGLQSPWVAETYRELFHASALANLFWFHGVIDTIGTDDELSSVLVGASGAAVFLLVEYYLARRPSPVDRRGAYGDKESN